MLNKKRCLYGFVATVLLCLCSLHAQESTPETTAQSSTSDNDTKTAAQGASQGVFTFPVEIDIDYGASNGKAFINRYMPLFAVPLGKKWSLINLTLATLAYLPGGVPGRPGNPEPVPAGRAFGLSDLTNAVFLTPPSQSKKLVWGFGPAVTFPIATSESLGSGKWSAGPAFRIAYRPGPWNLGAVVLNRFSFAGDSARGDINQLMVRGLVRRQLGGSWYFTHNPIITANWNASSGQRWLLPVGGGIGKSFELGGRPVALSFHYYYNAVKPEGAPTGVFRIDFIVPIPTGLRR